MLDFTGKTAFVADVPPGMKAYNENLIRELERYGCVINTISMAGLQGTDAVDILEQCDLAIHILGEQGQDGDMEEKQIMYSARYLQSRKLIATPSDVVFDIYAWYPKSQDYNTQLGDGQLPNLINKIQQMEEVELLCTTFEEFKNYIFQRLAKDKERFLGEHYIKGDEQLHVYFIYDAMDRKSAEEYMDFLRKRGFVVVSPIFSGDIMEVRRQHNVALKNFDLVIIFAQDVGINWVNMKIMDILKSPGLGREKDILGKAILASDKITGTLTSNSRGFEIIPTDTNTIQGQIDVFLRRRNT